MSIGQYWFRAYHLFRWIDDHINIGDTYNDLAFPFSISVWVNIQPGYQLGCPILVTQDDNNLYDGIWFFISYNSLSLECGDGRGKNNPAYRRGKSATIPNTSGRWTNVTAVVRNENNMDFYLNGSPLVTNTIGNSTFPPVLGAIGTSGKIGYHVSNNVIYRFKGSMDELRIFNKALTANEIRQQMCKKLTKDEPNLIGHWTFNEMTGNVLHDTSLNQFHGSLIGNPTRIFSSAPIGDESVFLYTSMCGIMPH